MSFNQNKYINEYNKNTYKMYQFRVRKDDNKIIKFLDKKNERNNYLISLIKNDINKKKVLTLKQIKNVAKPILNKYGIKNIYLFGSYARGEANIDSDVDIFCDKGNIKSLIDQGIMEEELENALKKKVDIIFDTSLMDEYFKNQIMDDMIKLC